MELSEQEYHHFRDLIAERAGLYFDPAKQDLLTSNLLKRMEDCGLSTFTDYFQLLCSPAGTKEFDHLLNLITIPETYFFRDQAQFMALKRFVIPELLKRKSHPALPLRIWSAGCSTGEEPYTIAMILAEGIPGVVSSPTHILATDVNHAALEGARRGIYGARSVRDVPEEYLNRFFTQKGGEYHLDESIKQMVEFRHFNLVSESYPPLEISGWDIIFCRNVTIYFKPESTRRVIHNLYKSLKEGGYLFAGFSESLRYVSNEFDTVQVGGVFLYQKGAPQKRQPRKARQTRRLRRLTSPLERKPRIRSVSGKEAKETQKLCSRAKEFLEIGQPEKASELLTPYLDKSTAPESVFLLLAEIALNQGELEKAAQLCRKIIRHQPLSHGGHFLLGIVYWSWEDERRAIEAFEKVLSLKPEHALARFNLGDLYSQAGQLAKAKLEYTNAMRLLKEVPDSFDEWFAGGFSPALLIDTCLSRLRTLDSEQ
ncbi:MAG: tetratricopeptide repeat protein [Deltaproteobacteria bacterium]|nr:MAG: tetratricopeptide repeat protein [Deltaproteobacteria bacterium]